MSAPTVPTSPSAPQATRPRRRRRHLKSDESDEAGEEAAFVVKSEQREWVGPPRTTRSEAALPSSDSIVIEIEDDETGYTTCAEGCGNNRREGE